MRKLFDLDSGIMRFLSQVADLMILNLTFLICCIPVFTIGTALTSLTCMTMRTDRGEEGYMLRGFLKAFKENFKKSTLIWLVMLAIGAVIGLDLLVINNSGMHFMSVYRLVFYACIFVYIMVLLYVFPLQARFENPVLTTLKNACIFAIAYFPYTMLMTVVTVGAVLLTFVNANTFTWGLLVWILLGFALVARINSIFLNKIFAKYIPEEEKETDPDHWELSE